MKRMTAKFTITFLLVAVLAASFGTQPARAASIVVNSNADTVASDGVCTLREAIINANADDQSGSIDCVAGSGVDTITFAGNYTITLAGSQLPAISTAVTINGTGAANTIIQANAAADTATYRVFQVTSTGILTLNDATVRHGRCDGSCAGGGGFASIGGGILSEGETNINDSVISNNTALGSGGGIYHSYQYSQKLTIQDSTLNFNVSSNNGGAIFTNGLLDINNSTFENNGAVGGGAVAKFGIAAFNVSGSVFSNNSASNNGGAIYLWAAVNASVTTTDFVQNAAESGMGGGIHNDANSPTITSSSFRNNTAGFGGGGVSNFNSSHPTITNVTFSENSAVYGGGMYNYNDSSPLLTNLTFSANSASTNGGGMFNYWNNSSPTFTNVIIANSTSGGDCVNGSHALNPSSANNLIEDAANACGLSDGANGNIIGEDPLLGALADNGGSTETHALLFGSPAIEAGTNTGCPADDQRGVTRPQSSQCDIGAYELAPTFADVPVDHPYFADIEIFYANGLTAGCSAAPLNFCPEPIMNRAESAVFMLRGNFGNAYTPPSAPWDTFADNWTPGTWAEKWAEGMYTEGLTAGCALNPLRFCPWDQTNREQAAVFGLKLKYGNAYLPPAATGDVFADMTDPNYWGTKWAEQAYADDLLPSCGIGAGGKPNFCPASLVNRGLGAYMIVRAKSLTMP